MGVKITAFDKIKRLLAQVRPRLAMTHRLEFKNCFGAVAGYVNGHIFISYGRFGVALRLPPEILGGLLKEKGVRPLKYFPRGHVKKSYAVLSKQILRNKSRFRALLDKSVGYASTGQVEGKGVDSTRH